MKIKHTDNSHIIILLLILTVTAAILPTIKYIRLGGADESYYLRYAYLISNKGLSEFRGLFTEYLKDDKNWVFPNPLRIGAIFISSMWCKIFGSSFINLAYLSFLTYILFIVMNYIFCRRIFNNVTANLLSFLIVFSPINLAMSRRALSDSLTVLFLGLSIWIFLDMIINEGGTIKKILFMFIFSFSILIKESCILYVIPLFIFMFIYQMKYKGKVKWPDYFYLLVYPEILVLAVYFLSSGNLLKVIEVIKVVMAYVKTNRYAIMFGSGPWFRYIIDFMLLSPWTLILSVGYVFNLILNLDKVEMREMYFLIVLLISLFLFNFLTKNVRYIMILDLSLRLFSVFIIQKLSKLIFPKRALNFSFLLIIILSLFDCLNFVNLFLYENIYDPVTFYLLKAQQFIPY